MTRRVVLVIPDAGPLISLGRADALDLLLRLDLPIYIVDQVRHEATRDSLRFPDANRINDFIRDNQSVVHEFATEVGRMAAAARESGERARQRGLGEAAIAEFLARLDEVVAAPDDPVMLLFEDSDLRRSRFVLPQNVHVVSTMALLLGMQERGLIQSAAEVWQKIAATGRHPFEQQAEVPAVTSAGRSSW